MSMETRRQEQDVQVYRCDLVQEDGRCVRETASFHTEGAVTVLMDVAWVVIRVSLGEEKHFCSWDHLVQWSEREQVAAIMLEDDIAVNSSYGKFAVRMRQVARERQAREEEAAVKTRVILEERQRSAALLEMP